MPDQPLHCQMDLPRRCEGSPVYRLHFTLSRDGCQFSGVYCRGCTSVRADQIRARGGEVLAVEDLVPPAVAGGE